MSIGAAVQQRKSPNFLLAIGHIQRHNQSPCSVVAADLEDGVGRRLLMSRRFLFRRRSGSIFIRLFYVAGGRMRKRVVGDVTFVAANLRLARFSQMTVL